MKVVHLSTFAVGGAANAARRLHLALQSHGVESRMLVLRGPLVAPGMERFFLEETLSQRVVRKWRQRQIERAFSPYRNSLMEGFEIFTDDRSVYDVAAHPWVREADIIQLHWVATMLDYGRFFQHVAKPVVWRLPDMNAFTGGCHYAGSCGGYKSACGACPQLGSGDAGDLSSQIFRRKRQAYTGRNIYVVTPSRWLAACVKDGALMGEFEVTVIPNSVPHDIFMPRDKSCCKSILGLPQDRMLLLFGADSMSNHRKGLHHLLRAVSGLPAKVVQDGLTFAAFGLKETAAKLTASYPYPIHELGRITDERLLSVCYGAADVFVIPSVEDNLPSTVLESMACGTPVVGFNVGGVSDMVRPAKTGLLAKPADVEDLREQIRWIFEHPRERQLMGRNARQVVEHEYTPVVQAEFYVELYESLLANRAQPPAKIGQVNTHE